MPSTDRPTYDSVEVGTEIASVSLPVKRLSLVQYCGASGDFNTIHWSERIATGVGLPNVIAHGMFTMASAGRLVTDWVGDPGAVLSYGVRFSRPVVVPDDDAGVTLTVRGVVEAKLDGNRVQIALTATVNDEKVLSAAKAVVLLP